MLPTFPIIQGATPSANPVLTAPVSGAIIQCNGSDQASIAITGSLPIPFLSVQARVTSLTTGTVGAWTTIQTKLSASSGSFSGSLTSIASDDYTLQVRTLYAGVPNGLTTLTPVGIGDIFISAGQSLIGNYNQTVTGVSDTRIRAKTVAGVWSRANDPQPQAGGSGGSVWPSFATNLLVTRNRPIGLVSLAIGGTSVNDWSSPSGTYWTLINQAVQSFPANGFRAFIWTQGDTDGVNGMTQLAYTTKLEALVDAIAVAAGWAVPCGIAIETIQSGTSYAAIAAAQAAVQSYTNCFVGANFDSLNGTYRFDGTHFNLSGQQAAGVLWSSAIKTKFGW